MALRKRSKPLIASVQENKTTCVMDNKTYIIRNKSESLI